MGKLRTIKYVSFYIFFRFIPENALIFISGILVSAAINILTSPIPESITSLGANYIASACSLLTASAFMIAWAAIIKPIQEAYKIEQKSLEQWYLTMQKDKKSTPWILLIVFLLTVAFIIASVIFFFCF